MVQISLKKVGRMAGILMLVILAGTFLLLFTDLGRHGHAENARKQLDPFDLAELQRFSRPANMVTLDSVQKSELRRIYAEIIEAYSNRQVDVLREWRKKLPEKVELIGRNNFEEITRSFFRVVFDELHTKLNKILAKKPIGEEFCSVTDFEHHANSLITLALIYGDVQLRRRELGGLFDNLEAYMYYRIKSYMDNFCADGRKELAEAAEHALDRWVEQIESENGYTRALLIKNIAFFRVWGDRLMEENGKTWEEISQGQVRGTTHRLIWAGYTPKWIEEFKNIPRHATPLEKLPK